MKSMPVAPFSPTTIAGEVTLVNPNEHKHSIAYATYQ
jgi:hypothetical protein